MSGEGEDMKLCRGCRWMYQPKYEGDTGYCGPCARTRGLEPRNAETDRADAQYAKARASG